MHRFFIDPHSICQDAATLGGSEAKHLVQVLRLRKGASITLFDGQGTVYEAVIREIRGKEVSLRILRSFREQTEDQPRLTVLQAVLKGKKTDLLVQKATELGIARFQPVASRYAETGSRSRQHERWQRIMLEACKQCNRPSPMEIAEIIDFPQAMGEPSATKIMFWEQETANSLSALNLPKDRAVSLLIGPEGGFHPDEVALARLNGFTTVSFGSRILRAETASLAAMTICQFLLDGFSLPPRIDAV